MNFSVIFIPSILTLVTLWQLIHHPSLTEQIAFDFIRFRTMTSLTFNSTNSHVLCVIEINKIRQIMNTYPFHCPFYRYNFELFDPNLLPYTILNLLIVERFTVFRVAVVSATSAIFLWQFIQTFKDGILAYPSRSDNTVNFIITSVNPMTIMDSWIGS
jgi:hypothetical protein